MRNSPSRKRFSCWGAALLFSVFFSQAHAQVPDGRYTIISRHSGLALDVSGSSLENGANVIQWNLGYSANQQFDVTDLNNGYYSVRPVHSGKSLDVFERSRDPGGEIRQWDYHGSANQQWQIIAVEDGYQKIISRFSGLALDVWQWSSSNGGDIRQWTDTGNYNQQWDFQAVGGSGSDGSGAEPIELGNNLASQGGADGSSKGNGSSFGNVNDGDAASFWQPSSSSGERISVKNLAGNFNTVVIRELNGATTNWRLINHENGDLLSSGSALGAQRIINDFGTISAGKINLMIDSANGAPQIAEFEVYNASGGHDGGDGSDPDNGNPDDGNPDDGNPDDGDPDGGDGGSDDGDDASACLNTPSGYASLDGGTTGGAGGTVVTVSTGEQMVAALSSKDPSTPLTIRVNGTLTPGNSGGANKFDVKSMNNLSIIGVGNNGVLDGIGIKIWRANNIIIRNLTIRFVSDGGGDGIGIEGESNNVWIDHNTVHNSLNVDKDFFDGLVDVKNNSNNVSITYNYLHSSWKSALNGHTDSGTDNNRRVTYAFNRWKDVNSRTPLIRFADTHVYNNYYDNIIDTGINSRMGARTRIDNNVFENSANPIVSCYSRENGFWDTSGNSFDNVDWSSKSSCVVAGPNVQPTISFAPPYYYELLPTSQVKDHVISNAGAGKCEF